MSQTYTTTDSNRVSYKSVMVNQRPTYSMSSHDISNPSNFTSQARMAFLENSDRKGQDMRAKRKDNWQYERKIRDDPEIPDKYKYDATVCAKAPNINCAAQFPPLSDSPVVSPLVSPVKTPSWGSKSSEDLLSSLNNAKEYEQSKTPEQVIKGNKKEIEYCKVLANEYVVSKMSTGAIKSIYSDLAIAKREYEQKCKPKKVVDEEGFTSVERGSPVTYT